jgi:hypothetical protein
MDHMEISLWGFGQVNDVGTFPEFVLAVRNGQVP